MNRLAKEEKIYHCWQVIMPGALKIKFSKSILYQRGIWNSLCGLTYDINTYLSVWV